MTVEEMRLDAQFRAKQREALEKAPPVTAVTAEVVAEDEGEFDLDEVLGDVCESMDLLRKCMHLLDYLSDSDLCPKVGQKEREAMSRMSEKVNDFLDGAESQYDCEE